MKKLLITTILIWLTINTFAQDRKWNKIYDAFSNNQYDQAIELAQKYIKKNNSNPGPYYVIGLSNFYKSYKLNTKEQFYLIRRSVSYLHDAFQKDKDSSYYKIFKPQITAFKDSIDHLANNAYLSQDIDKAKYYAQTLIFLFSDTTDIYNKLFPKPKPKKNRPSSIIATNGPINQLDAKGRRQGLWIAKYPSGKIKYEIYFKDGHPAGIFRRYYPNGQLLVDMHYEPTGHRAAAIFYDMDGHRIAMGYYYDKKRDSLWQFFVNDTIVLKEVMYKRGVKNGFERIYSYYYYPNLLQERYYKNGKLDSVAVDYYYDGTPQKIMFYKNGKLDGPFQVLYYNGKVKIKGQYKNDYMEGTWLYYNPDGSVDTVKYHLGEPINKNETEAETKILKAMESAKGKYPEPEEMFKKQFHMDEW